MYSSEKSVEATPQNTKKKEEEEEEEDLLDFGDSPVVEKKKKVEKEEEEDDLQGDVVVCYVFFLSYIFFSRISTLEHSTGT